MRLTEITPNPTGSLDRLFALSGDISSERLSLEWPEDWPGSQVGGGEERELRLLHINDLHSHLVDFSAAGDVHRMAQLSKLVKQARAAEPGLPTLFLSMGDEHIGTVWDELLGTNADDFQCSASYQALSMAGLDVAAVGNHELDKGAALLARAIEQDARFPVLSANLLGSRFPMPWLPAAIGLIDGLRIAFIGVTTVIDTHLETEDDPAFHGVNPAQTAARLAEALGDHVDLILCLSHVGYNGPLPDGRNSRYALNLGDQEISRALAKTAQVPVVLLGGHSHSVLNRNGLDQRHVIAGIPNLQAGEFGRFLGEATIRLSRDHDRLRACTNARLIATKGPGEETTADLDMELQTGLLEPLRRRLAQRLEAEIALLTSDCDLGDKSTIADRYCAETAMANFMNDAIVARSVHWPRGAVDFAAFNATGMRGLNHSTGPIRFADWYHVMPYADEILVFELTGAELMTLIENNARRMLRPDEHVDNGGHLNPAEFISRGFQHFSSGVRYRIQPGDSPLQTKAVDIELNGLPVDDCLGQRFQLAVSGYIGAGREGYDGGFIKGLPEEIRGFDFKSMRAQRAYSTHLLYRGEIISFIREEANGQISTATGARKDGRLIITN